MVYRCELDLDLLTYFLVVEARGMKFGPSVQFQMPMSVVDLDGIHHDLLTYFYIFETRMMKFLFQVTYAEAIHTSQYILTQVSDHGPLFGTCMILFLTKISTKNLKLFQLQIRC